MKFLLKLFGLDLDYEREKIRLSSVRICKLAEDQIRLIDIVLKQTTDPDDIKVLNDSRREASFISIIPAWTLR